MQIESVSDFREAIRNGPFAWPGGYPLFFICDDGGIICPKCAKTERRNILESIVHGNARDWRVRGVDVNWEDSHMECEHCGEHIESAYAD